MATRRWWVLAFVIGMAPSAHAQVWSTYFERDGSAVTMALKGDAKGTQPHALHCSYSDNNHITIEFPAGDNLPGEWSSFTVSSKDTPTAAEGVVWLNQNKDGYAWHVRVLRDAIENVVDSADPFKVTKGFKDHEIPVQKASLKAFLDSCADVKEPRRSRRQDLPVTLAAWGKAIKPAPTKPVDPVMAPAQVDAAAKKLAADALAAINATEVQPVVPGMSNLEFCNRTSKTLWLFIASPIDEESGKWHVQGWFEAKPKKCGNVLVPKGLMHYFAQTETRQWKGKDGYYCMPQRAVDKIAFPKEKCIAGEQRLGAVETLLENDLTKLEFKP